VRILRGGSNASFLVAVSQPKIDDSRSVTGILVVVIYSIPIEWLIWEGSMSQKMRWKTAGLCLIGWLTVIIVCMTVVTSVVMIVGMTACSDEPTTEYLSEEEVGDLIFIK